MNTINICCWLDYKLKYQRNLVVNCFSAFIDIHLQTLVTVEEFWYMPPLIAANKLNSLSLGHTVSLDKKLQSLDTFHIRETS